MNKLQLLAAMVAMTAMQTAFAADVYTYPKQGQSAEQQSRDDFECYRWATQRTGYDPRYASGGGGQTGESTARGAVGGAVLGAAIGGIASGNAGKGAAIGGLLGGVSGNSKGRQQEAAAARSERDAYNRAYKACMEGRGYSVS